MPCSKGQRQWKTQPLLWMNQDAGSCVSAVSPLSITCGWTLGVSVLATGNSAAVNAAVAPLGILPSFPLDTHTGACLLDHRKFYSTLA